MLRFQLLLFLREKTFFIARRLSVNDFTLRTHTCGELRIGHESLFIPFFVFPSRNFQSFQRVYTFEALSMSSQLA